MNNTISIDRFSGISPIIVPKSDTIRVLRLDDLNHLFVFVQVLNTELKGNQLQDMCQCFGLSYEQVGISGGSFLKCDSCEEVNQFVRITHRFSHIYIQGVKNKPIRFIQSYNPLKPDVASTADDPKTGEMIRLSIKEADGVEIRHQEELGCGTYCIPPANEIIDDETLGWGYWLRDATYIPMDMLVAVPQLKDSTNHRDNIYLFKERHDFACSPAYGDDGTIIGWGQPNTTHASNFCMVDYRYDDYPEYTDYKARNVPTTPPAVINKKKPFPPYEWVDNPDEVLSAVLNATPNDIVMVSKEAWDASLAPLIEQYPHFHVTADETAEYFRTHAGGVQPMVDYLDANDIKLKPQMNFFKVGNMLASSTIDIVGMVKNTPDFKKVVKEFFETGDENLSENEFLMASTYISVLMDIGIDLYEYSVVEQYTDWLVQKAQAAPESTVRSAFLRDTPYPKMLQPLYIAYYVDEEHEAVLAYTHPLSRDTIDETVSMDYWVMYANQVVLSRFNTYDVVMTPPVMVSPAPHEYWHDEVNDVYSIVRN